ncbi:uncharacterized protein LOC113018138 isoform X1 [Astatotilapia calliptera]|uniref:uncharacterized protein LOC113018138 isoform X1 n=1 Tax=Astatotilapia calliptera TaxID=8154 RepID=UPI000E429210|nr:uncharacterized protein LOC113018138 isoform X1 [Astatotilapia calliptera]
MEASKGIYKPIRVLFNTPIYNTAVEICWYLPGYRAQIAMMMEFLRLQKENQIPSSLTAEDMGDLLVERSKETVREHLKMSDSDDPELEEERQAADKLLQDMQNDAQSEPQPRPVRWKKRDRQGDFILQRPSSSRSTSCHVCLQISISVHVKNLVMLPVSTQQKFGCCLCKGQTVCDCPAGNVEVSPGAIVALVTINGRYNLALPVVSCTSCGLMWSPSVKDFQGGGYWPGTLNFCTLFSMDVFQSFYDIKKLQQGCHLRPLSKCWMNEQPILEGLAEYQLMPSVKVSWSGVL